MFQIKNRFFFSSFATRDIARICLKNKKRSPFLVTVPLHTLKLVSSVRKKLNKPRETPIVLEKDLKKKLAIIVPYRNRAEHLQEFLPKICKFLDKTKISYHIFIIAQKGNNFFNRGALINLGVKEFGENFDYFCSHDVDLLPIRADYACYNQPLRLVSFITDIKEKIPKQLGKGVYNHHFGGIMSIKKTIFLEVNGFSNLYYHHGLEDDDFFLRLLFKNYIPCKDLSGYYLALPHAASKTLLPSGKVSQGFWEKRKIKKQLEKNKKLFSSRKRELKNPFLEGLNTLEYKIESIQKFEKHTFCNVHLLGDADAK